MQSLLTGEGIWRTGGEIKKGAWPKPRPRGVSGNAGRLWGFRLIRRLLRGRRRLQPLAVRPDQHEPRAAAERLQPELHQLLRPVAIVLLHSRVQEGHQLVSLLHELLELLGDLLFPGRQARLLRRQALHLALQFTESTSMRR